MAQDLDCVWAKVCLLADWTAGATSTGSECWNSVTQRLLYAWDFWGDLREEGEDGGGDDAGDAGVAGGGDDGGDDDDDYYYDDDDVDNGEDADGNERESGGVEQNDEH